MNDFIQENGCFLYDADFILYEIIIDLKKFRRKGKKL